MSEETKKGWGGLEIGLLVAIVLVVVGIVVLGAALLLGLFAGEELFLLGSEYFAQNPPRPLSQAVGMVNLDVVGVGPSLSMEGGATTPLFQMMAAGADRLYGGFGLADRQPTPAREGASDHSAFVRAGVPTVYFHSGGAEGRAHTPADVADTIDFAAYHRTTLVVYLTIFQMADRP